MNRSKECAVYLVMIAAMAVLIRLLSEQLICTEAVRVMKGIQIEHQQFRSMQLSDQTMKQLQYLSKYTGLKPGEILAVLYPETKGDYLRFPDIVSQEDLLKRKQLYISGCRDSYTYVKDIYGAVWNDISVFPVSEDAGTVYENSWMFERSYGGLRGHEGTDLMPERNIPGHYRILSMTDGIVEKIGWLPKGGYRIGVRSPSGAYFYYAHLDSYEREFSPGDAVQAGQILGYMGDTGYGEEGTRGEFPVHLHLGIYVQSRETEELSINPYWVLRYMELKTSE